MSAQTLSPQCCIAGGGPAGMMLGLLLARAGVEVLVLEKHADFLRDFRGDTIHPSTLEIMYELGVLDDFLKLPYQEASVLAAQFGDFAVPFADFSHLRTKCKFIAFMPQWHFLNFLAERAAGYPSFKLQMRSEVTGLIEEGERIVGVRATGEDGPFEVRAPLVVGADGRSSSVREHSGLQVVELGAPMDVLWFALPRTPADPAETAGRIDLGRIFIMVNRGEHWQMGFVIPKGSVDQVRQRGLPAFHQSIAALAPFLSDRVDQLNDWEQIKLLTVRVNRLNRWYRSGLLCIGDAAHAMSPVGGVGINLAIQDAVAAARILAKPLRDGTLNNEHLRLVQQRRELPTRLTQRLQVIVQNGVIKPTLGDGSSAGTANASSPPLLLRLVKRFPILRRLNARLVGIGFRPEHVTS